MIQVSGQDINEADAGLKIAYVVGAIDTKVWGMRVAERLRRTLESLGPVEVHEGELPTNGRGSVLLFRGDYVLDPALVRGLAASPNTVLTAYDVSDRRVVVAAHVDATRAATVATTLGASEAGSTALAGLRVVGAAKLASSYDQALRKRAEPYVLQLTPSQALRVERRIFDAAYKGVTDIVTKYAWPTPAFHVTRWAAARSLTPNMVTAASLLLVLVAMAWFWIGSFVAGLVAAWGMTFLDTVDGKLARTTLKSSPTGNAFDHGIDLLHPPFWYYAWWHGLVTVGESSALLEWSMWIIVVGYVVGRLLEGLFLALFKFELHAWRRLDSWFRLVTARRNPNLILLTAGVVANAPESGFFAVAVWTVASTLFHVVRIGQALAEKSAGRVPVSWLSP